MPSDSKRPLILVAEDDPDDVLLIRLAVQRSGLGCSLFVARDGQEIVEYLEGAGPYAERSSYPLPKLLLLDIKMPRLDGFDVLGWLRNHEEFGRLPVIMLSGSELQIDREKAKKLGARDYCVKQAGIDKLVKTLRDLHAVWIAHD